MRDGTYTPFTVAGCGKEAKGQLDDIPEAILPEMSAVQKESLSFTRSATKGRFKTANRSDSQNSKPNINIR